MTGNHPVLLVTHAGYGETPPAPDAIFKPGDVVKVARRKALNSFPRELVVLVAVPPGFPVEYALADLLKEPRPLMITKPRRVTQYILAREGDPKPYVTCAVGLLPSGKPAVQIGTVARGEPEIDRTGP